ncbi:hypothetical protein C2G38_2080284, partial [Gigaspora rosea]
MCTCEPTLVQNLNSYSLAGSIFVQTKLIIHSSILFISGRKRKTRFEIIWDKC